MLSRDDFFEYLVETGKVSEHDMRHVVSLCAQSDENYDQVLAKTALLTEYEICESLSCFTKLLILAEIPDEATAPDFALNPTFLEKHRLLFFSKENKIHLAMVDPLDQVAQRGAYFALGGSITPEIISNSLWERHFHRLFPNDEAGVKPEAQDDNSLNADAARLADMASSEPVIRLVNRLIEDASRLGASDIHLEPSIRDASVRFRIDGVLRQQAILSNAQCLSVVSRIKILSELDIAERRRPQDGRMSFPVAGKAIDLRVSTVPTEHGESLVLRLLDKSTVDLSFAGLGFTDTATSNLKNMLAKPHGILLVTGPTGSGKTTSLYTFLQELTSSDKKILTIEDPIEYRLPGISQSQVNPQINVTFASALRAFLRHDPDVMMVGEIRDLETATIAIQAALTGHLVLSTLHTNDAASAITRLRDLGVEDYLIASTLVGVVGQRLVRKSCHDHIQDGCFNCDGAGLTGRLAITEVLKVDESVRQVIRNEGSEASIVSAAPAFVPMISDGQEKIAAGLTTESEVIKALGELPNMRETA